jgi:proliferating cell nuclear antigen
MEVVIKAKLLKSILKALNPFVNEARFRFGEDGLSVRVVDQANICMCIIEIPSSSFESYDLPLGATGPGAENVYGIDVPRLFDFSKMLKNDDTVSIDSRDGEFILESGKLEYALSLIDLNAIRKEPKEPNLNLPVEVELNLKEFSNFIKAANKLTEHISLETNKKFLAIAEGDLEKLVYDSGIEVGSKARSLFSLEYVAEFVKVGGDIVTIDLGTNYPGKFTFFLDEDDGSGDAYVTYILAPRIEAEG